MVQIDMIISLSKNYVGSEYEWPACGELRRIIVAPPESFHEFPVKSVTRVRSYSYFDKA